MEKLCVRLRKDELDWYVLKYDVKTTEYNNEIVFQTYNEAIEKYNNTHSSYINERIELIFSPKDDDVFKENELVLSKME